MTRVPRFLLLLLFSPLLLWLLLPLLMSLLILCEQVEMMVAFRPDLKCFGGRPDAVLKHVSSWRLRAGKKGGGGYCERERMTVKSYVRHRATQTYRRIVASPRRTMLQGYLRQMRVLGITCLRGAPARPGTGQNQPTSDPEIGLSLICMPHNWLFVQEKNTKKCVVCTFF